MRLIVDQKKTDRYRYYTLLAAIGKLDKPLDLQSKDYEFDPR